MIYCNSKTCPRLKTCINHIVNTKEGTYQIKDYFKNECIDYKFYRSIKCIICNKEQIYAKGMCKACYYRGKYKKITTTKKRKVRKDKGIVRKRDKEKIELIIQLREQGKSFSEIAKIVGISRQRVHKIYNDNKNYKENKKNRKQYND